MTFTTDSQLKSLTLADGKKEQYIKDGSTTNLFILLRETSKAFIFKYKINGSKIKSITIGVNINPQLLPVEAGILSINEESFVSGNIIDRLLRADMGKNEYRCITPLEPLTRGMSVSDKTVMTAAINNGIHSVFLCYFAFFYYFARNSALMEAVPGRIHR